ncbi:helix-turn-helix transcriptional regulator [Streptomyces sp. NPDC003395]
MPRPAKVPTPPPPGYVWIEEAVRRTGLSKNTLYNYRYLGKGPQCVPIGRKLAYSIAGLDAFMRDLLNPAADSEALADSRPPEPRLAA